MEAILKFNLPDEQIEHQNAVDAGRAFSLLNDIVEKIRSHEKYKSALSFDDIRQDIYTEFPDLHER